MSNSSLFHLAIPISNLALAKEFYGEGLGCSIGRENQKAIIFNFYGHQLVAHMTTEFLSPQKGIYPRHFGLVFDSKQEWDRLQERACLQQLKFYQEPKLRFPQQLTEHWTFFLEDPFYNFLEFKYYCHQEAIFGGQEIAHIGDR